VKVWFALNVAKFAVVVPLTIPLFASVVTMELAVRCVFVWPVATVRPYIVAFVASPPDVTMPTPVSPEPSPTKMLPVFVSVTMPIQRAVPVKTLLEFKKEMFVTPPVTVLFVVSESIG
jgi:hypothetical protein